VRCAVIASQASLGLSLELATQQVVKWRDADYGIAPPLPLTPSRPSSQLGPAVSNQSQSQNETVKMASITPVIQVIHGVFLKPPVRVNLKVCRITIRTYCAGRLKVDRADQPAKVSSRSSGVGKHMLLSSDRGL